MIGALTGVDMPRQGTVGVLNLVLGLAIGAAFGVGGYTFVYARGFSYLSNDPAACDNCHVMNEVYHAWSRSSHHAVATCNDCHTPHDPVGKYLTKALNGYHHSMAFTLGDVPDNIRITPRNAKIAQEACLACHAPVVEGVLSLSPACDRSGALTCARCHGSVGHPF